MPVYTATMTAPENSTDVYRQRRRKALAGLGVPLAPEAPPHTDPFAYHDQFNPAPTVQIPYRDPAVKTGPTASDRFATGAQTLTNLLSEGGAGHQLLTSSMEYSMAKEDRRDAELQARLARERAARQEKLAQLEIGQAEREAERLRQLEMMQGGAGGAGGMPSWIVPAALAGGGALLLLMVMKKTK